MARFDPYQQSVVFLAADGTTPIDVPLPVVDSLNHETAGICINYGAQLGASFIMLLIVLIMTPSSKLGRPSSILHILGLVFCTIRMTLLSLYFTSHFNDFYAFWARDFASVPSHDYIISIASTIFSLLLLITVEMALMYQAWTMVTLWPPVAKIGLSISSASIALLTIGWRVAFTVIQSQAIVSVEPSTNFHWFNQWMVITNCLSICWFCALFNLKLVIHLITNRGLLPSYSTLTPMEVLIMTNGLLMTVPVLFSGLEWGHFTNFESASLTLTSVAVILPLGTLAAQRMTRSNNFAYPSDSFSGQGGLLPGTGNSSMPLKGASFSSSCRGGPAPQVSILSRCEASVHNIHHLDALDLELGSLDSQRELVPGHVRVDRDFEQRIDRIQS
jgi:pheromone alpha factor receptor